MTALQHFHLLRPAWLLLLPVVVGLWWWQRQFLDPLRGWRSVIDRELLDSLAVGQDRRSRWRGSGLLAAWTVTVIALAGPTWKPEPSPFADDPIPVMILLRAEESMKLKDLVPSRMERAQLKVRDFAEERRGQPLGLIAWAGTAHLVLPPTRDTEIVATMAAEVSPEIMPKPGDNLAAALKLAEQTLHDSGGSILIVADTLTPESRQTLADWQPDRPWPVSILAIAREQTPELTAIQQAAGDLNAGVTLMTPDRQDVQSLVRQSAATPVFVTQAEPGTRWQEAGWWLVPVIALFTLTAFRRSENAAGKPPQEQAG